MDDRELEEIVKLAGGPGYEPPRPNQKKVKIERPWDDLGISPFLISKASAQRTSKQKQQPLYGDFWRTGEVSLLFGESGIGKSLLATQIAEVIARGAQDSINGLPTAAKPIPVIYFDFERTREQFGRIYSCQPYSDPELVENYKFSRRFSIARLEVPDEIPEAFKNNADKYIRYYAATTIAESKAHAFIIDNLANLSVGTTYDRVMRTLRIAANRSGSSVLVIAHAKLRRRLSEITLADLSGPRSVADIADTVFAIGRSTLHPDIRYVKDLKSRTAPLTADLPATLRALVADQADIDPTLTTNHSPLTTPSAVLSYRIDRVQSPLVLDENSEHLSSSLQNSSNFPLSTVRCPFLGLRYLGLALESKHLPPTRIPISQRPKTKVQKPRSLSTVNMLLSKDYQRYLEP